MHEERHWRCKAEDIQIKNKSRTCGREAWKKIKVAEPPAKLFPRTEIGNSLWVWLLVQKYLHEMPQNRILKQLSLWGLSLPAGTVTGGCKLINDLLEPLLSVFLLPGQCG